MMPFLTSEMWILESEPVVGFSKERCVRRLSLW